MIHAFSFSCNRDWDLACLMEKTLAKYCPIGVNLEIINTDTNPGYAGYGNGSGWPQGLLKLKYLRNLEYDDTDFVLSVDSDIVFTSPKVFDYVNGSYGIIGTQHQQPYLTEFGKFGHMSGALIFLRGDIARKIANLSDEDLNELRYYHFKRHNLTENEDVMLSYFARFVGASSFDLGSVPGLSSGDFEQTCVDQYNFDNYGICHDHKWSSFYHLNYCPTRFMDVSVTGKWDIARVLKEKGITL
jgi:hypothetical protein